MIDSNDPNVCAAPYCTRTDIDIIFHSKPICERCHQKLDELGLEGFKAWLRVVNTTES